MLALAVVHVRQLVIRIAELSDHLLCYLFHCRCFSSVTYFDLLTTFVTKLSFKLLNTAVSKIAKLITVQNRSR